MSEHTEPTCEQLRELGPELALGVLSAKERAGAISHLGRCPACCAYVCGLTRVGDALLELLPGCEPPVGFEDRVLTRLAPSLQRPRRRARWRRAAGPTVAAAAALSLGFGSWALGTTLENAAPPPAASSSHTGAHATLLSAVLTSAGRPMGHAYAHLGPDRWVFMSVDADGAFGGRMRCQLQRSDGSTVDLGTFTLSAEGYGTWGTPYPSGGAPVSGVRLLHADGSVAAAASFPRPSG